MIAAATTSKDDPVLIDQAKACAAQLEIPFIPRKKSSLDKLRAEHQLDYLLVVETDKVVLKGETTLAWHPSMAVPRLKALREGGKDPLIEALSLQPGYTVLDCTLGLGADALVAAYAVGREGHVTALEADKYIAFITAWGLRNFRGQNTHVQALLDRVTVINLPYEEYLGSLPDNSFEAVYFDPMFRRGREKSSSLNALRPLARHEPLSEAALREALRVAKRRVVLKENAKSREFTRLQAPLVCGGRYSPVAYGVWTKNHAEV